MSGILSDVLTYAWPVMFKGGTSFLPSLPIALCCILAFGFVFKNRVRVGTPLIVAEDVFKGFLPQHAIASAEYRQRDLFETESGHRAVRAQERLSGSWLGRVGIGVATSAAIFFKIGFLNVRIAGSSGMASLVILNWLVGVYFLAGWAWILQQCPPWRVYCS